MKHLLEVQGRNTTRTYYVNPDKVVYMSKSKDNTPSVRIDLDDGEESCVYVRGELMDIKAAWEAALGVDPVPEDTSDTEY